MQKIGLVDMLEACLFSSLETEWFGYSGEGFFLFRKNNEVGFTRKTRLPN